MNDDAPDPEPEQPDAEKMSAEEYQAAMKDLEDRSKIIRFRKAVSGHALFIRGVTGRSLLQL